MQYEKPERTVFGKYMYFSQLLRIEGVAWSAQQIPHCR
jgi:hypothetical protein